MMFIPADRAVPAAARLVNTDPPGTKARPLRGNARAVASLPFELAAIEPFIDPALLEAAARRADILNVGCDEVVRAHDLLSPDAMAQALAARLGVQIDRLDDGRPPDSERVLEA